MAVEELPTQQLLASEPQAWPMPSGVLSFRIFDQDWQYGCCSRQWLFTCSKQSHKCQPQIRRFKSGIAAWRIWTSERKNLIALMLTRSYGLPRAGHFSSTPSFSDVRFHLPSVDFKLQPLRSVRFASACPHVYGPLQGAHAIHVGN
jgi:hypothetical protein